MWMYIALCAEERRIACIEQEIRKTKEKAGKQALSKEALSGGVDLTRFLEKSNELEKSTRYRIDKIQMVS